MRTRLKWTIGEFSAVSAVGFSQEMRHVNPPRCERHRFSYRGPDNSDSRYHLVVKMVVFFWARTTLLCWMLFALPRDKRRHLVWHRLGQNVENHNVSTIVPAGHQNRPLLRDWAHTFSCRFSFLPAYTFFVMTWNGAAAVRSSLCQVPSRMGNRVVKTTLFMAKPVYRQVHIFGGF